MYDNLRYYFEFRDLRTEFHRWRVEIHQNPALGVATATELTAADNPVRIEYPEQDFYAPLWPTVCTITVIDTEGLMTFRHLYLAGKNAYYVKVWDTYSQAKMFEGYVVPELYEEAYVPAPYEVRLHASNQLARLQDFRPTKETLIAKRYWSLIEVLDMYLKGGTGLALDFHVQANVWEERHVRNNTMLDETFVVYESLLEDENKAKNGQEAAENILNAIGARVFYCDGVWVVQRYIEQGENTPAFRYAHTDLSCSEFPYGLPGAIKWPLPGEKFMWAAYSQVLQTYPPRQSIEVNLERDVRGNMFSMGWAGAGFDSTIVPSQIRTDKTEEWYTTSEIDVEERYYINLGKTVLMFPGLRKYELTMNNAIAVQRVRVRNVPLSIKVSVTFFWEAVAGSNIDPNKSLFLRLRMQLGDKYYVTDILDGNNQVTLQALHFTELQVAIKDLPSGQPYTLDYEVKIPDWGSQFSTDEVDARLDIMKPDLSGADTFTINFAIVSASISQKEAAGREDNTLFAEVDSQNTYAEAPKRDLFYYDSFEYLQNCLFLKNAKGNHVPTRRWEQHSEPGRFFPLAVQTIRELFQTWSVPNNMLSGTLTSTYRLSLLTTFDETFLGARMMVVGMTADLRDSSYEVTLQEFHNDTIE